MLQATVMTSRDSMFIPTALPRMIRMRTTVSAELSLYPSLQSPMAVRTSDTNRNRKNRMAMKSWVFPFPKSLWMYPMRIRKIPAIATVHPAARLQLVSQTAFPR